MPFWVVLTAPTRLRCFLMVMAKRKVPPYLVLRGSMIQCPVFIWERLGTLHLTQAVTSLRFGVPLLIISESKCTRLQLSSVCWFMGPYWEWLNVLFIWITFKIILILHRRTLTMYRRFQPVWTFPSRLWVCMDNLYCFLFCFFIYLFMLCLSLFIFSGCFGVSLCVVV